MSSVGLARIRANTVDSMREAIQKTLTLIDYSFKSEIQTVVIKPNLCYYWDHTTGQTTDPRFVAAIVDLIREKIHPDTKISIVESDASAMRARYAFRMLGYEKLSQTYNVPLVNLSLDKCNPVEVTAGRQRFRFDLPHTIKKADLKINVPKIKYTREEIKITCALKNIFGCNPYPKKFRYHTKLGEAIVAINKLMKFDLCLLEGNIVSGVQPSRLGLAMASEDPVAIDVAAAKIAGLRTNTIRYIQLAGKEGLGNTRFITKGEPIDYFKTRYPTKNVRVKLMNQALNFLLRAGLGKRIGLE